MKALKLSHGYSMLEMLIALLVISIGLLGVATLQSRGQQFNYLAHIRTQATFLAYDIMDRMRTNVEQARLGTYQNPPPTSSPECMKKPCSWELLAQYDLFEWYQLVRDNLPEGSATIISSGEGAYIIELSWDERGDGNKASQRWEILL